MYHLLYVPYSERKNTDIVGARGWDSKDIRGLKGFDKAALKRKGVRFEGDEEEDDGEDEDDDSGEFESYHGDEEDLDEEKGNGPRGERRLKDDSYLDDMFEKTLEEYGSDDMGDLEDDVSNRRVLSSGTNPF